MAKMLMFCERHKLTRHQYYVQLRKDILEDRVHCNEETIMFLAALALQAEFGDFIPEVGPIVFNMVAYLEYEIIVFMII